MKINDHKYIYFIHNKKYNKIIKQIKTRRCNINKINKQLYTSNQVAFDSKNSLVELLVVAFGLFARKESAQIIFVLKEKLNKT